MWQEGGAQSDDAAGHVPLGQLVISDCLLHRGDALAKGGVKGRGRLFIVVLAAAAAVARAGSQCVCVSV